MGVVITVNHVNEIPENFNRVVVGVEEVELEGFTSTAETKIYKPDLEDIEENEEEIEEIEDEIDDEFADNLEEGNEVDELSLIPGGNIENYERYILKHSQKYPIVGVLNQREFKEILRIFSFDVYINSAFAISYSKHKGKFAHSAFRRLKDTTEFKIIPYQLDLLQSLEKIITSNSGITIKSGWFSNLGLPNLDSVLLRGEDVNQARDWRRFKETGGASLSNIELMVEDNAGQRIPISLSKNGILYCKRNISPEKSLELTDKIFNIILSEDDDIE